MFGMRPRAPPINVAFVVSRHVYNGAFSADCLAGPACGYQVPAAQQRARPPLIEPKSAVTQQLQPPASTPS